MNKSAQMANVRSKNTAPEVLVRKLLSSRRVRYRLHRSDLPGTPDIFIGRLRLAIFVNGCFWHGHLCKRATLPKTNSTFWKTKIDSNVKRDLKTRAALDARAVETVVMWTCELKDMQLTIERIAQRYANSRQH